MTEAGEIVAMGVCGGCHERKVLVAHGAACIECVAAAREPRLRQSLILVVWDESQRPEGVDGDEWAYVIRMGGVDADHVHVIEDLPMAWSEGVPFGSDEHD